MYRACACGGGPRMAELLIPEPLTAAAFAPFGEVIETSGQQPLMINEGNTERYHDLANIQPGENGRAILSLFRGQPRTLPMQINILERHPLGSQAFYPLSAKPYLVVVARGGTTPDESTLRAFLATPTQGVNYAPGTWHHPLISLQATSDFLVIDRQGPGNNCEEYQLRRPRVVAGV